MSLFVNKIYLIIAFIPIVLFLIMTIYNNFDINWIKQKKFSELKFQDKKKYFNSSFIINTCNFKRNSLFLFNFSNNLEFVEYSNIKKNISSIFDKIITKNINYKVTKIPKLNTSENSNNSIFSLLSGNSLVVSFNNIFNYKYKISYSILKNFSNNEICSMKLNLKKKYISNFLISCIEYNLNDIFCVYTEDQNPHGYLTKLKLIHFSFNGKKLKLNSDEFLQSFNYQMKNIQLIKIEKDKIILIIYKINNQLESYMLKNLLENEKNLEKCGNFKEEINLNLTEKRKAFNIFESGHKVYIEGHRGGISKYQENSILSFEEAIKENIDSIELDVWLTKDNIPIVLHGENSGIFLKRYEGDKFIENLNINNVTLDFIQKINEKVPGKEIPTLEEVLDICKNKIFINIELKDYQYELTFNIVTKLIESKNMFDQISLSSLRHKYIPLINEYNKNNKIKIECGYIFKQYSKIKNIAKAEGCSANIPVKRVNEELIQEAHKNGIPVMVYFTNTAKENDTIYEKLINYGVDVICCNHASKALKFRDKYYFSKYNISNSHTLK